MLSIRLWPMGRKNQKQYRIVVADSRAPVKGKYIEKLGFYDPRGEYPQATIYVDRAKYWLSVGAQPSDTVKNLFRAHEIVDEHFRLIPAPGTASDPIVQLYGHLLKDQVQVLRKNKPVLNLLARRLAKYTSDWAQIDRDDFVAQQALKQELFDWFHELNGTVPKSVAYSHLEHETAD